jgi:hypothetical protein
MLIVGQKKENIHPIMSKMSRMSNGPLGIVIENVSYHIRKPEVNAGKAQG